VGIRIGYTATRRPLTDEQLAWTLARLTQYHEPGAEFHHGDCVGGDEAGFAIARAVGYHTAAHPPSDDKLRAFTKSDVIYPARSYRERNEEIVDAVTILLVVPLGPESDFPRSGTWQTARYARRSGCPSRNWWYERNAR
jgi:hypothetical protein